MRARATVLVVPVAALVLLVLLLGGCSGPTPASPASSRSGHAGAGPSLGGPAGVRRTPPAHEMNRLEKPVAARLARRVAREGLTLSYLDCPPWSGAVPSRISCRGFVDGLVAKVAVRLRAAVEGRLVFDARLDEGVIATRDLEATLRRKGWEAAECGDQPAYAAWVGSRIVCRVTGAGVRRYVVATVRGRSGAVAIAGYRPAVAEP